MDHHMVLGMSAICADDGVAVDTTTGHELFQDIVTASGLSLAVSCMQLPQARVPGLQVVVVITLDAMCGVQRHMPEPPSAEGAAFADLLFLG